MGVLSKSSSRTGMQRLGASGEYLPIVICLVGITGEGKSTTGNTISGQNSFQASAKSRSVTRGCAFVDFVVNQVAYRVIDTPGLQDTNLTPAELLERFKQFADLAPQGVDSFLFVCKRGRFKQEHVQAFQTFQEACTSEALTHTAFLFTNLDEETNDEFKMALREEACEVPNLTECLRKVNGRVIGIDNKGGVARSESDRKLVIDLVSQIRSINLGRRYSNDLLHEAEQWRRAVETEALKLESFDNRETMKAELDELLHGRRGRAQVEEKLIELYKKEQEARRVWEEAEAARKAKELAEQQIKMMQAQAEAARKAKEEAARKEEQRRIEACARRAHHERKSSKELADRSEARQLLLKKLQGEQVDIMAIADKLEYTFEDDFPEEVYAPPKKRIEQTRKTEEEYRLMEQDTKPRWSLHEDDSVKARRKTIQEDQARKEGEDNLAWLMAEITKERSISKEITKIMDHGSKEITKKANHPPPLAIQSTYQTITEQKLWERNSVTSQDSGESSTVTTHSGKISLAGPLSDGSDTPKGKKNLFGSLQPEPLDEGYTPRSVPSVTRSVLTNSDYKTPLTSTYLPEPRKTGNTPRVGHRSLLTETEKKTYLGSKERGSLLSPDLAELLATIADNGCLNEQAEMGA